MMKIIINENDFRLEIYAWTHITEKFFKDYALQKCKIIEGDISNIEKKKKKKLRVYRFWEQRELEYLKNNLDKPVSELRRYLGRPYNSVKGKIRELRAKKTELKDDDAKPAEEIIEDEIKSEKKKEKAPKDTALLLSWIEEKNIVEFDVGEFCIDYSQISNEQALEICQHQVAKGRLNQKGKYRFRVRKNEPLQA